MATTGATEYIDSTTADVFIPEIWSALSLVAREQSLIMAKLADHRYEKGLSYGDTIHVPNVGNLTAQTKTKSSNAEIVFETITETNTDISIATWEYVAIAVESIAKVQSNRDLLKMYNSKMGYALGLAVDDVGAGLIDDFTNAVGFLAVELTDENVLRARQYLRDANAPKSEIFMVISPAQETGLLKLERFVNNDYSILHGTGERITELQQAYVTSFLRTPIYVSTNVEGSNSAGHDNGMFQREALAVVMQMNITFHSQYDIRYLVDAVVAEQLYGWKEMRDDHGVWMRGA